MAITSITWNGTHEVVSATTANPTGQPTGEAPVNCYLGQASGQNVNISITGTTNFNGEFGVIPLTCVQNNPASPALSYATQTFELINSGWTSGSHPADQAAAGTSMRVASAGIMLNVGDSGYSGLPDWGAMTIWVRQAPAIDGGVFTVRSPLGVENFKVTASGSLTTESNATFGGAVGLGGTLGVAIGNSGGNMFLNASGGTVFTSAAFHASTGLFNPASDSTTAFQVISFGGSHVFDCDTVNIRCGIGTASPAYTLDVTGTFHVTGLGIFGGTIAANSGTNVVYRCLTAGALPIGALTITAASCGTSIATGFLSN